MAYDTFTEDILNRVKDYNKKFGSKPMLLPTREQAGRIAMESIAPGTMDLTNEERKFGEKRGLLDSEQFFDDAGNRTYEPNALQHALASREIEALEKKLRGKNQQTRRMEDDIRDLEGQLKVQGKQKGAFEPYPGFKYVEEPDAPGKKRYADLLTRASIDDPEEADTFEVTQAEFGGGEDGSGGPVYGKGIFPSDVVDWYDPKVQRARRERFERGEDFTPEENKAYDEDRARKREKYLADLRAQGKELEDGVYEVKDFDQNMEILDRSLKEPLWDEETERFVLKDHPEGALDENAKEGYYDDQWREEYTQPLINAAILLMARDIQKNAKAQGTNITFNAAKNLALQAAGYGSDGSALTYPSPTFDKKVYEAWQKGANDDGDAVVYDQLRDYYNKTAE